MRPLTKYKNTLSQVFKVSLFKKLTREARSGLRRHHKNKAPAKTIQGCLDDIHTSEISLSSAAEDFEQNFMNVLNTLETLEGVSSELTDESNFLLEQSKSDDNPIISTNQLLEPLLDFIGDSGHQIKTSIQELSKDQKKIDETLALEKQLNQTFSQLTYVRTLFRVEAAPLDQSVQVMFSSLVEEIHRLQVDVIGIFNEKFDGLRNHKVTITKMVQQLTDQANDTFKALETKRRDMAESVAILKDDLEKGIQSNAELNESSQKITQAIGDAIIALQTQDIINQKLQHIYDISEEMQTRYKAIQTKNNKLEKCRNLRFIEHASFVVSNQIHTIRKELDTAENVIRESLDFITTAISNIEKSFSGKNTTNRADPNKHLLTAFHEAEVTIRETEMIAKHAFNEIEPIRGMASNVTEIILGLSAQLHLIGLNAEVHAARAGGGSGLETLSSKTSDISRQTRSLCSSVSTELDSLVNNLNTSVSSFETLYQDASKNRIHLEDIKPDQNQKIKDYSSQHEKSEQSVNELSENLIGLIETTTSSLDFKNQMYSELDIIEKELAHLSRTTKAEADRMNIKVDVEAMMENLFTRYTMQSEKSVHMSALGLPTSNADACARESANNVDFFVPEFPMDPPNEENNRLGELSETTPHQKKEDDSGFGDNAELF